MPYVSGDLLIKIAVADDHTLFRETLCRMINDWKNCKVILQADNGKKLIEQLNAKICPDLILTDIKMPDLNGYETIKILKNRYPLLKILVISMFESKETLMLLLKLGANGFINKSADTKQLKKAIYEVMRTGYYFSDYSVARVFKQVLDTGNANVISNLNDEELFFLKLLCTEKTYKEIAADMKISERHVEYIRNTLFERFNLQSRTGLAIYSIEKGIVL